MTASSNAARPSSMRNAVYSVLIIVINGALIWTIWNYKSMPVAYSFDGSWGSIAIRAPWGKGLGQPASFPTDMPGARPIGATTRLVSAPPIKVDIHGNPERGSSYRMYRCMVDGYWTFTESPCESGAKPHKPAPSVQSNQ
jgi:hypothetical protein